MAPATFISLLSDDEGEESAIIDLTGSLSPQPENSALETGSSQPRVPVQTRSSSSKSTPNGTPHRPKTVLKNTFGPEIKFSPPSTNRPQNHTAQDLPSQVERTGNIPKDGGVGGDEAEAEDDGVLEEDSEQLNTPSKRSSRGRPSPQPSQNRSVGTDSPLISHKRGQKNNENERSGRNESPRDVMARRSLSNEQESYIQRPNVVDIEESLRQFQQRVLDDHAETARWLLYDARRLAENSNDLFMDKVSPFSSLQHVNASSGPAPDGCSKVKVESQLNKKKSSKIITYLNVTKISSDVPRVPKYSSHTIVRRNILCGDDEKLKFIPFLGDIGGSKRNAAFNRLVKELEEAYSAQRDGSSEESEWATKLRSYIDVWLEELDIGCDQQALVRYVLEQDDDDLGKSHKEIKNVKKSCGGPLEPDLVAEAAKAFSQAFANVFMVSLKDVILPDERRKELLEIMEKPIDSTSGRSQSESPRSQANGAEHTTERLGTFTNLTCLICGAISCQTHGDYTSLKPHNSDDSEMADRSKKLPTEYQYTHEPLGMHYNDILRKQEVRLSKLPPEFDLGSNSVEPPCSDECYRTFDYHGKNYEFKPEDLAAVKSFLITMRPKNEQPCNISFFLDLPCWQVHSKILELKDVRPQTSLEPPSHGRWKAIDWYDNKKKALKSDWQELTTAHLHQERCQANPCAHDGPCQRECPCHASNILCETFCGCPDDCPRKFTGCTCHASGIACFSDSCICIAMNRECGPQCTSCGAVPRINPRNKYDDDLYAIGCQNIVLQRGVDRKLMIGESQLEGVGFGLYLGEPVRKGEYLSEYAGEVISFAEADRRGIIYDRKYLSFLFDLNSEWCIDAARMGNKTRFINHADNEKDGLNCEAKIFLVNGEHRIKFVALRDLAAGEELLFNYGKKFAEKHGLSKKLPKAKESGNKKGVVIGEEALEALDGNRARGRMTAIRGGHSSGRGGSGGSGGRKARKTAPIRDLVKEVEKAVQEDEMFDSDRVEEGDEDDGDEITSDVRKKRKIIRPMRYSR